MSVGGATRCKINLTLPGDYSVGEPSFYTIGQVAELLGVSSRTIYRRVWRNELPHVRVVGGGVRIHKSHLAALITPGETRKSGRH